MNYLLVGVVAFFATSILLYMCMKSQLDCENKKQIVMYRILFPAVAVAVASAFFYNTRYCSDDLLTVGFDENVDIDV